MTKEYEGKNEQEAIELAMADLGLGTDEFEVEILDSSSKKGLFFRKTAVKIRVHYQGNDTTLHHENRRPAASERVPLSNVNADSVQVRCQNFLSDIVRLMDFEGTIELLSDNEEDKFILNIVSPNASVLIGKKGKTLDALQLLVNSYLSKLMGDEITLKAVVDAENYRERHEEALVKQALRNAEMVVKSKRSRLLEPMNPFERRIIHTTLNERNDVLTQSEGEGLYKQVRIIYKGSR
jgi:spoIIIJ-associated protein